LSILELFKIDLSFNFSAMKFFTFIFGCLFFLSCHRATNNNFPEPIGDDEEENLIAKAKWIEAMHRSAPGQDWQAIKAKNKDAAVAFRQQKRLENVNARSFTEYFANWQLGGIWVERGPTDNSGAVRIVDYDAPNNNVYAISSLSLGSKIGGGSLWRRSLNENNWTLLNDDKYFNTEVLKIVRKPNGTNRIFVASGKRLYFSDYEGADMNEAVGFQFLNYNNSSQSPFVSIFKLDDAYNTIYVDVFAYYQPFGTFGHQLFRSIDGGLTFSFFYFFPGSNQGDVDMMVPYGYNKLVVVRRNPIGQDGITMYEVEGENVLAYNSNSPVLGGDLSLAGLYSSASNKLTLYIKTFRGVYKREKINNAWNADWLFMAEHPYSFGPAFDVSMNNSNTLFAGGIEVNKSIDAGINFTKIGFWLNYYNNVESNLHADIPHLHQFRKTDNTVFLLISNDGGLAVSYDDLATTHNLSITGLRNSQSYDILTDTMNSNSLFVGTQDQGLLRSSSTQSIDLLNSLQLVSGDYGYLTLTQNHTKLWAWYPGRVYYLSNPHLMSAFQQFYGWSVPGTSDKNFIAPIIETNDPAANEVFVAGGNLNGGTGSYVIKLKIDGDVGNFTMTTSQFDYDFTAHSTTNIYYNPISAIALSKVDLHKMYVSVNDGSFFYSNDFGTTWNKTPYFLPTYFNAKTIVTSKRTSGLLWYGGYDGGLVAGSSSVYKSTNGGLSFTPMSNGLPQTMVYEMAANQDETMLFAATEAGPYVYIVADQKWYTMLGGIVPTQDFTSVEFLRNENTVRFGTYGRGVFDFRIAGGIVLPIKDLQLTAKLNRQSSVDLEWKTATEINNHHFEIEQSLDGANFQKISIVTTVQLLNS
jgi:hypothetical protein